MRQVRIPRCARPVPWYIAVLRLHGIVHGAMGLPIHRDPGGTASPRMTNDAGPTVAPAPIEAAGSAIPCGPSVAPAASSTVAPSPSVIRSASGSQYVSHHTPRPICAPRVRSQKFSTAVPDAALANHGAATISTKVSTTSLRHTNGLHSGYSVTLVLPTSAHFATVAAPPATAPAASRTSPLSAPATTNEIRSAMTSSVSSTPTPIAAVHMVGMIRHASTAPRATLSRVGGAKVRL